MTANDRPVLNANGIFDICDKVVLVTGAAGLIGSRFCRVLAHNGAKVIAADLEREKTDLLVKGISDEGGQARTSVVDIKSQASVQEMVGDIQKREGCLDVLVHCAALDPKFDKDNASKHTISFEDFPLEVWQQAIQVNLTGAYLCVQEAARVMSEQGKGSIILFSSIYGLVAPDQRIYEDGSLKPPFYSVTKAGILGLTKYVASYYAGKNIRVNAISPGGIFHDHEEKFVESFSSRTILRRMASVSELDGALLFLASDASSYMTGANLVVDGGWTAI